MTSTVSGEPNCPIVTFGANAQMERLVSVLSQINAVGIGQHALIGGLAVAVRLSTAHRVTVDIDTVTDDSVPTAAELLLATIAEPTTSTQSRVYIEGVRVDLISTTPLQETDLVDFEPAEHLFLAGHRWALESASPLELVAGNHHAHLLVAKPGALLAMKAAALLNNRRGAKAASDLFDLLRLIENHSLRQDALSSLSRAPWGIGHLVATALEVAVIADPTVAYRSMLREGLDVHSLDPEQIRVLTEVFVEQLQQDRPSPRDSLGSLITGRDTDRK